MGEAIAVGNRMLCMLIIRCRRLPAWKDQLPAEKPQSSHVYKAQEIEQKQEPGSGIEAVGNHSRERK